MSADPIQPANAILLDTLLERVPDAVRRTDVLYYGGDTVYTVPYGGLDYDLPPRRPARILPSFDFPIDEKTGKRLFDQPRVIPAGWDGHSIARVLASRYGREGVVALFLEPEDEERKQKADIQALEFRIAQASQIKDWWAVKLDKVRPGQLPPTQPAHVRSALEFLHKVESNRTGRLRYVTRDGRDFATWDEAAAHLQQHWPELIHAAGGPETLINDLQGGRKSAPTAVEGHAPIAAPGPVAAESDDDEIVAPAPPRRAKGRK